MQLEQEKRTLHQLERQYNAALSTVNAQIAMLQAKWPTASRLNRIAFQKQLREQLEAVIGKLHGETYQTIEQFMNDSYTTGYVGAMYDLHKQGVPIIMPIDNNAAIKAVMTDTKLKHGVYKELGTDMATLKKKISNELTRGIATGMAYDDIARNIRMATGAPKARANAIVRTEGHRIQQASQEDARQVAKSKGADVVKQWDATLDSATRDTHRRLDGQIREVDEPFEINGLSAMYPGEFGDPAEDCNCRCVALTRARAALDADELKTMQDRAKTFKLDKSKSFADFQEKYLKAAEKVQEEEKQAKFVPAKTKEEATQYAGRFAENVSFEGVSLANANAINEQLTILNSKYPIAKLEEMHVGGKGIMSASYRRLMFSRTQMGKTLTEMHKTFLQGQERYKSSLAILRERFAGRKMPFSIQKTVADLESKLRFRRWGVLEEYPDPVKGAVIHEYGHILSDQLFGLVNDDAAKPEMKTNWSLRARKETWKKIYLRAHKDGDVYAISEYGATNHNEFFAECFVAREYGERLPDYIEEFMSEVLNGE